jgi:5-formyltetrahydrofolate cyclo-ligase
MLIYPIPVEVTQARIQLVLDQNAKASPNTIHQDLQALYHAKSAAVEAAMADVPPEETPVAPAAEIKAPAANVETPAVDIKV